MPVPLFLLLLFPFLLTLPASFSPEGSLVFLMILLLVSCGRQLGGSSSGVVCVYAELTVWLTVQIWFWLHVWFFVFFTPPFYFVLLSNCEPHVPEGCIPSVISEGQLCLHFLRSSVLTRQRRADLRSSALGLLITTIFLQDFHVC